VIDYGDAWDVLELTTSHPRRETVFGLADEFIDADLQKMVAKAKQLDSTICAVREMSPR
jgi:hypothetical protein